MCLDGQCAKNSWCNQRFDCSHGKDELHCLHRKDFVKIDPLRPYRDEKELFVRTTKQKLQLPQLSIDIDENQLSNSMIQSETPTINFLSEINSMISYYCNRCIGVQLYDESIACFCPPQYYGDKC
jgi:hypothetical protein